MPDLQTLSFAQEFFNDKKYKQCFLLLIQASRIFSHDENYLRLMLGVQKVFGDEKSALRIAGQLAQVTKTPKDHLEYMNLLMESGRMNEALDVGLTVQDLRLNEGERKAVFQKMVDIYLVFSDFEGIQDLIFHNHQLKNESYFRLAEAFLALQNDEHEKAIAGFREAVLINPSLDKAWVSLAILHHRMGDIDLALANIEKALDLNKRNSVAVKCYAIWMEQRGNSNLAVGKINDYLRHQNFDEDLTQKHIDLLAKAGRVDLAQQELLKLRYYFG